MNQSFNVFQMSFRKTDQKAPIAKMKQVFKVEKLNPQQEETIKSLKLHLIKLNNIFTTMLIFNM